MEHSCYNNNPCGIRLEEDGYAWSIFLPYPDPRDNNKRIRINPINYCPICGIKLVGEQPHPPEPDKGE